MWTADRLQMSCEHISLELRPKTGETVSSAYKLGKDQCWNCRGGGVGGFNPQFMSTDARFCVKIGFTFQSLCKISNISTSDSPSSLSRIPISNTGEDFQTVGAQHENRRAVTDGVTERQTDRQTL